MGSLIPEYEYDIFISYRQKDNKYDGWVTEFVTNLKKELEATFKEDISVYFDINRHDGLLETHDVDASLKDKIRCLVFIPVISRTYCDPRSYAWEHEFTAFIEMASQDQFGLKVRLPNGNVANRILPIQIHELGDEDKALLEKELGGALRAIDFIYREPGVNRPLTPDDDEKKNLNNTKYRNQINKLANAIEEIIKGLKSIQSTSGKERIRQSDSLAEAGKDERDAVEKSPARLGRSSLISGVAIIATLIFAILYAYPKIFKHNTLNKLRSSGERISVAVMPFKNMTNDTTWNTKPLNSGFYAALIDAYHETGRYKEAKKLLKIALSDFPGDLSLIKCQIILCYTEKDTVAANQNIEEYISICRDNLSSDAAIESGLAEIYELAGIHDKAENFYRKALLTEPDNPEMLHGLANFLINSNKNPGEGLDLINEALVKRPENSHYLDTKGWGLFKLGKYQEALKILEKSDSLKPVYNHAIFLHIQAAKKAIAYKK